MEPNFIEEGVLQQVLLKAGRALAKPALEAFEILLDESTPGQARLAMLGALTYLIMPIDLLPDFIAGAGFSDDLIALTAVINIWRSHLTPQIQMRAQLKLDKWFPPSSQ